MKINVIVEKEGDFYGAKVQQLPGVFTSGDNIEEIKSNIYEALELHLESLNEAVENAKKIEFEKLKIEFNYDLPSFFGLFNSINISSIAELAGLNPSLVRQYASSKKFPSETQTKRIEEAIHKLGKELTQVHFE